MKCPYCEQEMRSGYIHNAGQPVQWIPNGVKPSFWRNGLAKGAMQLGDARLLSDSKATAFCCPSCEVVIIPAK